jgi:methylphosphotriester-DNA--protein-cysteine methyltransferase
MPQRESASRRSARRKAQRVRADRDHAHARREEQIEAALTDYLAAEERIQAAMEAAHRRASHIISAASEATASDKAAARDAVRRLHDLLPVAEAAELCGLTQRAVRDLLADDPPEKGEEQADDGRE